MEIAAPLSGLVVPLDAVPDPVFAGKLAGDGAAIDPTTTQVLAPIAGTVTQLHRAHHALAITGDDGVEVLIHVGLDTVELGGRGFTPRVALGARVARGQPLLDFDADAIARAGKSLLTVIVVTSPIARLARARGLVAAGRDVLLRVAPRGETAAAPAPGGKLISEPIALPNAAGLHARPAAVLAGRARRFVSDVRVLHGERAANARSVVALMGLSTRKGDLVHVEADGPDAAEAVAALSALLAEGCGEAPGEGQAAAPAAVVTAAVAGELAGVAASAGIAVGRVHQHRRGEVAISEHGGTREEERARLHAALNEAALQLEALRSGGGAAKPAILDVHVSLLEDPDLLEPAEEHLARGKSAGFAWRQAVDLHAARLEALDQPLLRERAADIRDVGRRVLAALAGAAAAEPAPPPRDAIVIAEELTPSELVALERAGVLGICTTRGGATSHVAILARAAGIPAICGIDPVALTLADGTRVALDGDRGLLVPAPDELAVARARERVARQAAARAIESEAALAPARTRDGVRIEVAANIRSLEEARAAMAAGAEGVGLLRTELLYQDREEAPSEDEQAAAYRAMADVVGARRRFVIRTLDVGGDKPLRYLPLPREENPFLGLRGIRVSLERPELFRAQLRAILRAAPAGNVHVMFPMVAGLEELRAARAILDEERRRAAGGAVAVGVMIEVPSAAAIAEALAREVDFFSIGTNDLTQYALAMDRGHAVLAPRADALHPGVLRLIAMTVEGAHRHGRWVGVCGGLASDPTAAPLLVGLGADELSVGIPAIGAVKAAIGRWSLPECQALAAEALTLGTTAEVKALLSARHPAEPVERRADA
jgi:phosphocarrier protein FPr/phosphocarrier protein